MEESLDKILGDLFKGEKYKRKYFQAKIHAYWKENMNEAILSRTNSINLYDSRLIISVNSSTLRNELVMEREKIRTDINEMLEEAFIQEVIVK
jgi:hypothetical protein